MSTYEPANPQQLPAYSAPQSYRTPHYQMQGGHGTPVTVEQIHRQRGRSDEDAAHPQDEVRILGPGDIPDQALNLDFERCFYEHESTKTIKEFYSCLDSTYRHLKLVVYVILVFLLGIPFVVFYAIFNAFSVFFVVWIYQPFLRVTVMVMYALMPMATVPLQALLTPLIDVYARIFRQIHVKAHLDGPFAERLQTTGNQADSPV